MNALYAFNAFALVYFLVLNTTYLVLIAIAAYDVVRMSRRAPF